jgi:hypothetical protein
MTPSLPRVRVLFDESAIAQRNEEIARAMPRTSLSTSRRIATWPEDTVAAR